MFDGEGKEEGGRMGGMEAESRNDGDDEEERGRMGGVGVEVVVV